MKKLRNFIIHLKKLKYSSVKLPPGTIENGIIYREEMTELVGMWDTIDDGHWSDDMNMEFMNFLFKYFNIETFKDIVPIKKFNLNNFIFCKVIMID